MDLIWLLILNGHINGPENLSVLNMYFIEALIMVLFSSKLKVWLPYNKRFTNTSSVRFETSLTIFLTESKRVWQDYIKFGNARKNEHSIQLPNYRNIMDLNSLESYA